MYGSVESCQVTDVGFSDVRFSQVLSSRRYGISEVRFSQVLSCIKSQIRLLVGKLIAKPTTTKTGRQ